MQTTGPLREKLCFYQIPRGFFCTLRCETPWFYNVTVQWDMCVGLNRCPEEDGWHQKHPTETFPPSPG